MFRAPKPPTSGRFGVLALVLLFGLASWADDAEAVPEPPKPVIDWTDGKPLEDMYRTPGSRGEDPGTGRDASADAAPRTDDEAEKGILALRDFLLRTLFGFLPR